MRLHNRKAAFSLVELSIVLVILGLLVGGVLSGQSLIRAAELRAVSTEYSRYIAATKTFRDKYFSLPGDMNNATAFWSTAATCPGAQADARTTAATCNGNGDSRLDRAQSTSNEEFGFWQHLANAGLIEGTYVGVSDSATASDTVARIGWNVPRSKLNNAGWYADTHPTGAIDVTNVQLIEGFYGNHFLFGGASVTLLLGSVLKPEEAWNIDTKMDDGKPGTGSILIREDSTACYLLSDGSAGAASNTNPRNNIQYNLTGTSTSCHFLFNNAF